MANSNPALSNIYQPGITQLAIGQSFQSTALLNYFKGKRKWIYLLANKLGLNEYTDAPLQVIRPKQGKSTEWLEKLISAGQCCAVFVEEMALDEVKRTKLEQLCQQFKVTVFEIKSNKAHCNNLIIGPW